MAYPPTRPQIDAARIYLQDLFPAYKIYERLNDMNSRAVFSVMKGKRRFGELQIDRDFWDAHPTAEQVGTALRQHKMASGLRYFLSAKALAQEPAGICPDPACVGSLSNTTGSSPSCPQCGSRR